MSPRRPRRSVASGITSSGEMLPRLTDGPNSLMNHACAAFDGASKTIVGRPDPHRDLADQLRPHASRRVEDPRGAALPRLCDHLPRAGRQLLVHPLHPLVDGVFDRRVLRADLGEDREVAREVGDQLELALARDVDGAVRDLNVGQPEFPEPALVLVEPVLGVDDLEERAADHDRLPVERRRSCCARLLRHRGCAPAEFDDRDVVAGRPRARPPTPAGRDPCRARASGRGGDQRRAKSSFSLSWAAVWTSW